MTQETIQKYSPHNAKNLTQDDLAAMEHFSKDDLKALAEAYPHSPTTTPYLILKDKAAGTRKQIGQPATWKTLYELVKIGQTQFYASTYKSLYKPGAPQLKSAPVQDLTNADAKKELKEAATKVVPIATATTAKETPPVKEKSAEQIAKEESEGIDGAGDDGSKETPPVKEKALDKMNLVELQEKYATVIGEPAEAGSTKKQLIAAIEAKL